MPLNKTANIVADYLFLHKEGGRRVCELFLEAIEYARKEGCDPKSADLSDLTQSIQHN